MTNRKGDDILKLEVNVVGKKDKCQNSKLSIIRRKISARWPIFVCLGISFADVYKRQEMELGEPDASGRRKPVPKEGSNFELPVDCVIMAIGNSPNPLIRSTTEGLEANQKGCSIVDDATKATTREGVYAAGDAVSGAATVILAMGGGKEAAASIDTYIQNKAKK